MDIEALKAEIRESAEFSYSRSGGPGGQNVNKRDTKVTVKLAVSSLRVPDEHALRRLRRRLASRINSEDCIVIQVMTHRTQGRNREEALLRLEDMVIRSLRPDPKPRRATVPSGAAKERRLASKKRRSAVKEGRRRIGGTEE